MLESFRQDMEQSEQEVSAMKQAVRERSGSFKPLVRSNSTTLNETDNNSKAAASLLTAQPTEKTAINNNSLITSNQNATTEVNKTQSQAAVADKLLSSPTSSATTSATTAVNPSTAAATQHTVNVAVSVPPVRDHLSDLEKLRQLVTAAQGGIDKLAKIAE
jgi:hypothetical protein